MVSIGNIAKIGGIVVAGLVGYTLVKNAGNIGSSVGGFLGKGFQDLGSGLSDSFTSAFNIFGGSAGGGSVPVANDEVNTPNDIIVQSGGTVPPVVGHKEISTPFKSFIESGSISESFAEKFSFQPPATGGQLDISNTFGYLARPEYKTRLEDNESKFSNNYGGYGSAELQTNALAKAIEQSASKYPEWFA